MPLYAMVISLFLVMNVIGNIPLFIAILARYDIKKQRRIILREMIIALVIALLFNYFGDNVLKVLGISSAVLGIAGGAVLFLIALPMIFPKPPHATIAHHEPLIVPLATPVVLGPGTITTIMVYSKLGEPVILTLAIFLAWVPSLLILLAASYIKKFLGEKGLLACEKLGGLIIALIAVQMMSTGVINLVKEQLLNNTQLTQ